MKINRTITVDLEVWEEAQNHIDNISAYINDCLKGVINRKDIAELNKQTIEAEIEVYHKTIMDANRKLLLAQQALKDLAADKLLKAQELKELEQFKRWDCGACHHINFMDNLRCDKCNLPMRDSVKSKIFMLNGGVET